MLVGSRAFLQYRCRTDLQRCQLIVLKKRKPKHKLYDKSSIPPVQAMTKRSSDAALPALSSVPPKKIILSTQQETTLNSRVDVDGDTVRNISGCESKMEKRTYNLIDIETGSRQKQPQEVGAHCQQLSYFTVASSPVARTSLSGAGDQVSNGPQNMYQEPGLHAELAGLTGGAVGQTDSKADIANVVSATQKRLAVSTLINALYIDDSGIELRSPTCVHTSHTPKVPGFALLPMGSCPLPAFDSSPELLVETHVTAYTDVHAPERESELESPACDTLRQDQAVRSDFPTTPEGGKQTGPDSCKDVRTLQQREIIKSECGVNRNNKKADRFKASDRRDSQRKPGETSNAPLDKKGEKESKNPVQNTTLKESQKSHLHSTASNKHDTLYRKISSPMVAERQKVAPKSSTSACKKSKEGSKCATKQGEHFKEPKTVVTSINVRTKHSSKIEESQKDIVNLNVSSGSRKATVVGSVKLNAKETKVPRPVVSTSRDTKDDISQLKKKYDETLKSSSSCRVEKDKETHISQSIKQQKNAVKPHDGRISVYSNSGPAGSTENKDTIKETAESGGRCGNKRKDRQLDSAKPEIPHKLDKQGAQMAQSVSKAAGKHMDQNPPKSAVLPTKPVRRPILPASIIEKVVSVVAKNVRAISTEVVSLNSSFKEQSAASATKTSSDNHTMTTKAGCTFPNNNENQNREVPNANSEAVDRSSQAHLKSKEHNKARHSTVKDDNCKRRVGQNVEATASSDQSLEEILPVDMKKGNTPTTTNSKKATKKKNKETPKINLKTKLEEDRIGLLGLLPQYIPENDCRMKKKKKGDRVYNLAPLFSGNFGDSLQSPRRKRPNYFVAVQITNQEIKDGLKEVLASVEALNKKVKPAFMSIDTLHLTMAVMYLPDEEAIWRAKSVLDQCVCEEGTVSDKSGAVEELTFDVTGLGNFGDKVVFAKVVEGSALDRLKRIAETLQNCMDEKEIFVVDKGRFTPHITIMKMSQDPDQLRRGGVKKIAADLYKDCTGRHFGPQTVATLQLCAMNKPKRDNYYHIDYEVPFGEKCVPTSVKDESVAMEKQVPVEVKASIEVEVPIEREVPVETEVLVEGEVKVDKEKVPVNAMPVDVKNVPVGMKETASDDMKDSVPIDVKNSVATDVKDSMPVDAKDSVPVDTWRFPTDVKNCMPVDVHDNVPIGGEDFVPVDVQDIVPVDVQDSEPVGVKDCVPVGVKDCVPVDAKDSVPDTVAVDAKDSVPVGVTDTVAVDAKDSVPVGVTDTVAVDAKDSVPVK